MDNKDRNKSFSETVSKTTTKVSEASKDVAKKITPIALTAKEVGNEVGNKLSGQEIVNKFANSKAVSKIVDHQAVKKISKNKNKRIVLIGVVLAVVVLIILIVNLGGGSSGSCVWGTPNNFQSTSQFKGLFEGYFYETSPKITIGEGHVSVKSGGKAINGHQVIITGLLKGFKGTDNRFLVTDNGAIYHYDISSKDWVYSKQLSIDEVKRK